MDQKLIEKLQKYRNISFLCPFFTKTIKCLCKNFYNEKLELIFCEYNEKIEMLDKEKKKKNCLLHKLLIKFNDTMRNDFLSNELKKVKNF